MRRYCRLAPHVCMHSSCAEPSALSHMPRALIGDEGPYIPDRLLSLCPRSPRDLIGDAICVRCPPPPLPRLWSRNTPIRRRVQADVLCEALQQLLPEESPHKAEVLLLLAKLPSKGVARQQQISTVWLVSPCVAMFYPRLFFGFADSTTHLIFRTLRLRTAAHMYPFRLLKPTGGSRFASVTTKKQGTESPANICLLLHDGSTL